MGKNKILKIYVCDYLFGQNLGKYYVNDGLNIIPRKYYKRNIKIHHPDSCLNHPCTFHHPSSHKMVDWPTTIRFDKDCLVERECPCGIGHPDPDSLAFLDPEGKKYLSVHGCCGHCYVK